MPPVDEHQANTEPEKPHVDPSRLESNVMARPRTERAKKPLLLIFTILFVVVVALAAWTLGWKPPISLP